MSRSRFIAAERAHYPVRRLCQVFDVPASGYYAWQAGQQWAVGTATPAWETALVKVFRHHKRRYSTRRLQVALRQQGHRLGRQRLRVAMRRRNLHALQPQAFTPRATDSTHGLRSAPNWLLDQPKPTQANQVWVSDITYLPLPNGSWVVPGRVYLCAFQDMGTKHVVGWHVGASMPEELVTTALQRAFFAKLLHDHQALRSQSSRGDCYDNAQAESLWSRLKTEVLKGREWPVFADLADAYATFADYLTIVITSACIPASAIRRPITLTNNCFKLLP
jgi:putative transposase